MGISVMVLGQSGCGKSTSLENLDPKETILIKVVNKPLPFRSGEWKQWDNATGTGSIINTDSPSMIQAIIRGAKSKGKSIVVIDDMQYIMANEFMRRSAETGWGKFTDIAKGIWELLMVANDEAPSDVRVYFLSHTDTDDNGNVKAKTIGKLLDEKICIEGLVTVVLRAMKVSDKYYFATQNNGRDTCKSPKGMFTELEIENDLRKVDDTICDYYDIKKTPKKETK